eukprot:scaffold7480_cov125-Isochrysis_galbana.AAC.2
MSALGSSCSMYRRHQSHNACTVCPRPVASPLPPAAPRAECVRMASEHACAAPHGTQSACFGEP